MNNNECHETAATARRALSPAVERQNPTCRVVRAGATYQGKQGFSYFTGISRESAGAQGICMHLLTIPPGQRARAHLHDAHETAIYVLKGETEMWYGPHLDQHMVVREGDILYIPADMPHLPMNRTASEAVAVIARTDASEQESVVLLPELDGLVPD